MIMVVHLGVMWRLRTTTTRCEKPTRWHGAPSKYLFEATWWKDLFEGTNKTILRKSYRYSDQKWIKYLQCLRMGMLAKLSGYDIKFAQNRILDAPTLYSTRSKSNTVGIKLYLDTI